MERSFPLGAGVQYRAAVGIGGGLCRFTLSEEYCKERINSRCSPALFFLGIPFLCLGFSPVVKSPREDVK